MDSMTTPTTSPVVGSIAGWSSTSGPTSEVSPKSTAHSPTASPMAQSPKVIDFQRINEHSIENESTACETSLESVYYCIV